MVELSERSVQAISALLSLSQWVLGILAIVIAFIAIFGWVTIRKSAIARAEKLAKRRVSTYLESDEFKELVAIKVQSQLDAEWENRVVSPILDKSDKQGADASPFPERSKKGGA